MVAIVDPTKCRLYPEILPEAMAITQSASGTSIASYAAFQPFAMSLKQLYTNQVIGGSIRIDTDAGHGVLESPSRGRPEFEPVDLDIIIEDSMDLWSVGTVREALFAYTLRITQHTVFEKIKYGITLTKEEIALSEKYDIQKKYLAGILRTVDAPQYKRIIEVTKEVTAAAGVPERIGRIINVKKGEKAVMLGMSVDSDAIQVVMGGPGSNDTYLVLNRDVRDTSYVKLDCLAMPEIHEEISCHIPAIDRLEVTLESATGIASLPVRYRYGVADLSIIEKIRWGLRLTDSEAQDAENLNLFDAMAAGVL